MYYWCVDPLSDPLDNLLRQGQQCLARVTLGQRFERFAREVSVVFCELRSALQTVGAQDELHGRRHVARLREFARHKFA